MNKEPFQFFQYVAEKIYLIIFILGIGCGLIVAVFSLNSAMGNVVTTESTSNLSVTSFDQVTINKLKNFKKSSDNSIITVQLPRTSPFSE